jgi:DNA primase
MFDALRYLKDTGLQFLEAGNPDVSPGWVGISCPFCRDPKAHGGFNIEKGYYSCWRCGGHDLVDVIAALERIKPHEAVSKLVGYEISSPPRGTLKIRKKNAGTASLPLGCGPLAAIHKSYLKKRNFDPDFLEAKYNLQGTGPVGPYRLRIIAPIYLDRTLISYQGRDVTGKAEIPYKACPKDQEAVEHKDSLYNVDNARDTAIVVEGIFDVFRMGDGAVATFGVGFRWTQVEMMAERFKKVILLYDGEPKAQAQARKIVNALNNLGVKSENILLSQGDPAELSPEDALHIKEDLLS